MTLSYIFHLKKLKAGLFIVAVSFTLMLVYVPAWNFLVSHGFPNGVAATSKPSLFGVEVSFNSEVSVVVYRSLLGVVDVPTYVYASWWRGSLIPVHLALLSILVVMMVSGLLIWAFPWRFPR